MTRTRAELLSQLNSLLRLTQTEEMIARVRRTQATSGAVERELAGNAEKCRERSGLLRGLISDLGGVHDVVGVTVGRLSAAAKSQLEQGTTLSEALLSDLTLEHQLLDRAGFVEVLAGALNEPRVIEAMERLEDAHRATVDWINTVLADVATGRPTKLSPTTVQVAVATGRRVTFFGARQAAAAVNRSVAAIGEVQHRVSRQAGRVQQRAGQTASDAGETVPRIVRDTGEVLTAGRDAALARAEDVAGEEGATRAAETVRVTREALGALRADELPIKGYDALNAGVASARIERLDTLRDVQVVLAYEQAEKDRASVIRAAENRSADLTVQLSDVPS
jgi:hypothetical protein